jgi:hypothetical protein
LPFVHYPAVLREGIRRLVSAWQAYATAPESHGRDRVEVVV